MARRTAKPKPVDVNPLTGEAPNSFTKSTNRTLPASRQVRAMKVDPRQAKIMAGQRKTFEAQGGVDADVGYRRPEGMTHSDFYRLMGMHRDLPQSVPDISTPHATAEGAVLQRRAEDLSGREYAKGVMALKQFGTSPEKMRHDIGAALDRATTASVRASLAGGPMQRPAGERFYEGPSEPHDVISEAAERVRAHPNFPTTGDARVDHHRARQMLAMANSATSPNNPFRIQHGGRAIYPNNMAAESAVYAGLEGKKAPAARNVGKDLRKRGVDVPAVGVGTYASNMEKATEGAAQMARGVPLHELRLPGTYKNPEGNPMFDPVHSAKTASYVTAHAVPHSHPDEFNTLDIHEGHNAFPHLPTAKSVGFNQVDEKGNVVTHITPKGNVAPNVHFINADEMSDPTVAPRGSAARLGLPKGHRLVPAYEDGGEPNEHTGSRRRVYGNSRVEQAVASAPGIVHAFVDRAAREAAAERGMSPSVANALGTHRNQASRWVQQQIDRPDMGKHTEAGPRAEYPTLAQHASAEHAWSPTAQVHDLVHAAGEVVPLHEITPMSDYVNPRQFSSSSSSS